MPPMSALDSRPTALRELRRSGGQSPSAPGSAAGRLVPRVQPFLQAHGQRQFIE